MPCNHIYLENGQKKAHIVQNEQEYRSLRNTPEQVANLQKARQGDQSAKMRLVQFNYSGHFPNGIVKGTKLPSAAFGFDIDDPETFEQVAQRLLANPDEYGLLMLERSASQGGHAVFVREKGKTILENQVRIATQLQCEMDTNAHDINRVYFASTADPEELLYISPKLFEDVYVEEEVTAEASALANRESFSLEELPPNAHKACKHYKPWEEGLTPCPSLAREGSEMQATSQVVNASQESGQHSTPLPREGGDGGESLSYQGIPYREIIAKWWELYNDGKEPVKSNRDVLTFELAVNLRHICGFDRALMDKIIPCYDEFPQQQKMKCIDSALAERRTQMPSRLKNVLQSLRKDHIFDQSVQSAIDEINLEDDMYYYNNLPLAALPQGVIDSVKAVGETKVMPVILAIAPIIGMLATKVRLMVHDKPTGLNLITYLCGKAGSGKGSIDDLVKNWLYEIKSQDDMYHQQEREYRERKQRAKNAKEQPVEPKLPVRYLTLNNTLANLSERLANIDGTHGFSFTPEADTVTARWKTGISDYSVMVRQAYDGSEYNREARSADSVNVHIKSLLWNVTMCGTQDALYRLVTEYFDGFLSRLCIAKFPDNTFTPLEEHPAIMKPEYEDRIRQIAHLLPFMQGTLSLPILEAKSREWVEKVRLEAMKNNDEILADARIRDHVSAQRITACLMLCQAAEWMIKNYGFHGAEQRLKENPGLTQEVVAQCQTPAMMTAYELIADSILDNDMFYFREKIAAKLRSMEMAGNYGLRKKIGKNDTIYSRLTEEFTTDNAYQELVTERGSCNRSTMRQMLKRWKNQGLVREIGPGRYQKIA